MTTALILSGGGARAAYQVGVLKALSEITPHYHNPFPIVCGTSAGGINALALTGQRGSFPTRVAALEQIWRNIKAEEVYRTDGFHVIKNTLKLAFSLTFGGGKIRQPMALLDNSPIYKLLERVVNFRDIDEAVAGGQLQAIAITAMSYGSGQSITFFQGNHDNWQRARRLGLRTGLTVSHLVASASIPTLFPAVKIGNQYFGDGAVRQLKPLSPALHLGADRLFVIGVSDNPMRKGFGEARYSPPTLAGMMGHMFNSAFIDSLESDLETLRAINRIARKLPPSELGDTRIIDYLSVTPSAPINQLAARYMDRLPRSVRLFLRTTGARSGESGASAASYLLFEPGFCGDLIDMGYEDCLRQHSNILQFFSENGSG